MPDLLTWLTSAALLALVWLFVRAWRQAPPSERREPRDPLAPDDDDEFNPDARRRA